MELYQGVKISIGPPIADGFYYDFEFPDGVAISEADFPAIEERMREHVKAAERFERQDVSPAQARERFLAESQDYKVELIDDLVTAPRERRRRARWRLSRCTPTAPSPTSAAAPTPPTTTSVGAFKLQSVAGAYWRGDSDPDDAHAHLRHGLLHQGRTRASTSSGSSRRKARDHRKLGRELGLFTFSEVSPGPPSGCRPGRRVQRARRALAQDGRRARLQRGQDPADLRRRAVEDLGALGQVPGEHVHVPRSRTGRWA